MKLLSIIFILWYGSLSILPVAMGNMGDPCCEIIQLNGEEGPQDGPGDDDCSAFCICCRQPVMAITYEPIITSQILKEIFVNRIRFSPNPDQDTIFHPPISS